MPIEIKITDITNLTRGEINTLHYFLSSNFKNEPSLKQEDTRPIHPEVLELSLPIPEAVESKKTRKKRIPNKETAKVLKDSENNIDVIEAKNMDSLLNKLGISNNMSSSIGGEPARDVGRGNGHTVVFDDGHESPEITYDELISFIFESTREKKLKFEDITNKLQNDFKIPNLNELKNIPHAIALFYEELKEMVNNG